MLNRTTKDALYPIKVKDLYAIGPLAVLVCNLAVLLGFLGIALGGLFQLPGVLGVGAGMVVGGMSGVLLGTFAAIDSTNRILVEYIVSQASPEELRAIGVVVPESGVKR